MHGSVAAYSREEVAKLLAVSDVVLIDVFLSSSWHERGLAGLHEIFQTLERHGAQPGKVAVVLETGTEHTSSVKRDHQPKALERLAGNATNELEAKDASCNRAPIPSDSAAARRARAPLRAAAHTDAAQRPAPPICPFAEVARPPRATIWLASAGLRPEPWPRMRILNSRPRGHG